MGLWTKTLGRLSYRLNRKTTVIADTSRGIDLVFVGIPTRDRMDNVRMPNFCKEKFGCRKIIWMKFVSYSIRNGKCS